MTKSSSRKLDSYNEALYFDKVRKELFDYEPKRVHRFIVEFPNVDTSFVIQKADKPKFVNGKWQDMEFEFIDIIGPSTSQSIFGLTNPPDYPFIFDNRSLFDKILGRSIFKIIIKSLDPTGNDVEQWTILVKKVKSIDFGRFDYSDDGISTLRVVVTPKKCVLNF